MRSSITHLVGILFLLGIAGLVFEGLGVRESIKSSFVASGEYSDGPSFAAIGLSSSGEPRSFPPLAPRLFRVESRDGREVLNLLQLPPPVESTVPGLAHLLRLYGRGCIPHEQFSSGDNVIAILTSHPCAVATLGESLFFETRDGVRVRFRGRLSGQRAGESHRDLLLATFAELGIPLSFPLHVDHKTFAVRDLMADSIASFHLHQRELAWTAIAYAHYLEPASAWQNREGERYTFDDLANALLLAPPHEASCGSTHILHALTVLLRADLESRMVSAPIRARIERRLQDSVTLAIQSQNADGYWTIAWYDWPRPPLRAADTRGTRLLVTGHFLEWLTYLPPHLQPPVCTYERAAQFLRHQLSNNAPFSSPGADACPAIHALCALRNLLADPSEPCPLPASSEGAVRPQ